MSDRHIVINTAIVAVAIVAFFTTLFIYMAGSGNRDVQREADDNKSLVACAQIPERTPADCRVLIYGAR